MYKEITVGHIPEAKLKRAVKGGTLTLTKAELAGSSHKLHLHPESHAKVMKAKKKGSGVRLHIVHDEIHHGVQHGGSIWSSIWTGIKSLWQPVIKPALSAAADVAVPALAGYAGAPQLGGVGRQALKSLTGIGLKKGKVAKGSDEAKERMKHLRSMRAGVGGSFRL